MVELGEMNERMRDDELETALRDIGERLDYPRPVGMAAAVRVRLREPRPKLAAWWPPRLAPTLVTMALLAIVVALASPDARAAAGQFLHLRGIDIFPVPTVPASLPPLRITFTGQRTTLDDARRQVRFTMRVPSAPELGTPDDVFVESVGTSDRVSLVYRQRDGIPLSKGAGVSALVVEVKGTVDEILLGKATGPGTRIEAVMVNGAPGYWLEGEPHLFFYREPGGNVRDETLRLAGNTLVWVQDGVTIRLEAQISKTDALRIASTFR
jgi:hypothetical protein